MKVFDRQKLDPMALGHLDEHTAVAEALKALKKAETAQDEADRIFKESRRAYTDAQDAAAAGRRDDGQLRRTLQQAEWHANDCNIAIRAVELAQQRLEDAREQALTEVGAALRELHTKAVREFDAVMARASAANARVEAVEDHAERLLPSGHSPLIDGAQFNARPPRVAWRQVFESGGRYESWRKGCGVLLK